ncbi:hypothetical protein DFJ58DRAFT_733982 [Suillus subalutaceus]|uniref:uncharacterized protein n=1 Tax=Suillus subalutaceus TaxID=48586 RepID=UPI001B870902|nr:uncharacterized protein DFJ58DRAFT_733982 [Suillus subalutaceus]KAG1838148.1 hypothetical protein DFJ58DRAFT_733982 [Suillus subalutaceus]
MSSSSSLTLSTLLSILQTHLNAQTRLLPTLHVQLGLPQTAPEDELQTLQHTLNKAIESRIEENAREWSLVVLGVRECWAHAEVAGSLSDLKAEKVSPRRYESATTRRKLRQIYPTKLKQLTTLTNRLNALARTLGSQQDILTSAKLQDIVPGRFSKLEKELVRGKGEVLKRLNQLSEVSIQIDSELGIDPPPPTVTPHPQHSLTRLNSGADPSASLTIGPLAPTPSSIGKPNNHMPCPSFSPPQPYRAPPEVPELPNEREYPRSLGRFIKLLDSLLQESSPGPNLKFMWYRPDAGAMYDQLEALWRRMGVDEEAMYDFVAANRRTTPSVVQAYEEELERMIDLKHERMCEFIANVRTEIESLWEELLVEEE